MVKVISLLMVLTLAGCGGNNKEVGVTPNQENTVTVTFPAGATPEQIAAMPPVTVYNTMTMSDSPFKTESEQSGGGVKTDVPLDLNMEIPDKVELTPGSPAVVPIPEPEVNDPPIAVVPPFVGEWEILDTYDNLSSPDNIDAGRSFAWLQRNTGDQYPSPIRLRWPACNASCIIQNPSHDYNYKSEGGRDMSKCSWYSAMDGTDHHERGSFFSPANPACITSVGYIEKRAE